MILCRVVSENAHATQSCAYWALMVYVCLCAAKSNKNTQTNKQTVCMMIFRGELKSRAFDCDNKEKSESKSE